MIPGLGRSPGRRKWQPIPVFLPGESHGQRSLAGYSPRGPKELDMTEQLHFLYIQDDVDRLYANTMPLYIRGICEFWNDGQREEELFMNDSPLNTEAQLFCR